MPPESNLSIISRLHSAEGHLRAVTSMVENGAKCRDILHQLNAVQGALNAIAREFLFEHLAESERIINTSNCPEERAQALDRLIRLYHWSIDRKRESGVF